MADYDGQNEKKCNGKRTKCDRTKAAREQVPEGSWISNAACPLLFVIVVLFFIFRSEAHLVVYEKENELLKNKLSLLESHLAGCELQCSKFPDKIIFRNKLQTVSRWKRNSNYQKNKVSCKSLQKKLRDVKRRVYEEHKYIRLQLKSGRRHANHFVLEQNVNRKQDFASSKSIGPWTASEKSSIFEPQTLEMGKHHAIYIKQEGFYFVYGQVTFKSQWYLHVMSIKTWHKNSTYPSGADHSLAQCTHSAEIKQALSFVTCFTSGALWLPSGSFIEMTKAYRMLNIMADNRTTFMGLIKLS